MPYVTRDAQGDIISLNKVAISSEQEHLDTQDTEVRTFLSMDDAQDDPRLALNQSDKDIVRITEDLIHLLVQKNIILFTELPTAVQKKILAREALRSLINGDENNFLDEEEGV